MLASLLRPTLLAWPPGIHALPWVISDFRATLTFGLGDLLFLYFWSVSPLGMRNLGTLRYSIPLWGFGIRRPSNESFALYLTLTYGILVYCCPREIGMLYCCCPREIGMLYCCSSRESGCYWTREIVVLVSNCFKIFCLLGLSVLCTWIEAPNLFGPRLTMSGSL